MAEEAHRCARQGAPRPTATVGWDEGPVGGRRRQSGGRAERGRREVGGRSHLLAGEVELDDRLRALGVPPAAREEAPRDELVQSRLVAAEAAAVAHGVDGRVGRVVVPAVARPEEGAAEQLVGVAAPLRVCGLRLDERLQVEALLELVRLGARVGEVAALREANRAIRCQM